MSELKKPEWIDEEDFVKLCDACFNKAAYVYETTNIFKDIDIISATDLLIKLELEKLEKNLISDNLLDFNDEITDIEELGEMETIDISVSGDNLFYCNGILTKNSFGLPATADLFLAMIQTPELVEIGQILFKQLKNRYGDTNFCKTFVVGVDKSKMQLFDVEESAQAGLHEGPVMDQGKTGDRLKSERLDSSKFDEFF